MKTLLNKKYKYITKKGILGYGSLTKDLKNFLKTLTLNDKHEYIINIFTDVIPTIYDNDFLLDLEDDDYDDTYAILYYEELSSFDGENSTLIESKISEIIEEMGERLERLNWEGCFYPDTQFYLKIYRKTAAPTKNLSNSRIKVNDSAYHPLKLSCIKPEQCGIRTLHLNSAKWKRLRLTILNRDNFTCSFCEVRASKYMIVDHINGDATDNSLTNLRVNCPMCDSIRHCGLAGHFGSIEICESKLSQLDIVKKTREFYLKNNRCPEPTEVDSKAIKTSFLPIDIVRVESYSVKKKCDYKAFFTNKFCFKFLECLNH